MFRKSDGGKDFVDSGLEFRSVAETGFEEGKATFSVTVMESKRAPSWKSMPILRRWGPSWRSESLVISEPSTVMDPAVAGMRPMTSFRKTLLPVPEPPMMTRLSPWWMERLMPRRICWEPMDFSSPRTVMKGVGCAGMAQVAAMGQI